MKVIDAQWEKRNLGVSSYEIRFQTTDDFATVAKNFEKIEERQYMVVKIPSSRYDLAMWIQSCGYIFIESAIGLEHNMKEITMSERIKRACDRCTWSVMDTLDEEQLYSEIEKNIFRTDRIYIDPEFSKEQAANRYLLWVKDLINKGSKPVKVLYDGKAVGFFLNSEKDNKVYDGLLAATYSGFEGTGMGYCIQYAGLKYAIESGARKYLGHVSANNPPVLKCLMNLGLSITDVDYIFIKHCKGE